MAHSHHLLGVHPPDGVFQRDELNEGKSSARTYIGLDHNKRGLIPIWPWQTSDGGRTTEWDGTREAAFERSIIRAGALGSLGIIRHSFLTC